MKSYSAIVLFIIAMLVITSGAHAKNWNNALNRLKVNTSIVSIPVASSNEDYAIGAVLNIPKEFSSKALVIIVHGSKGVDTRGQYHQSSLHKVGIATLELDLWAARGMLDGSFIRPRAVHETLPDVFAAFRYAAQLPQFDEDKIGILGFSWGGVIAMLSRETSIVKEFSPVHQFAAHVAFYPVCWGYTVIPQYKISTTTQKPILILTGELDDYDLPTSCDDWKQSLSESEQNFVTVEVFKDAHHAFNSFEPQKIVVDPFSHLGQGGDVLMKPNKKARKKANRYLVDFFKTQFDVD
ncbi:dienelactone hydrolase family protein [Thalassotalea marina]|uniref:Dienelactone hydrolase domain-containing protein n=1 Tax=Thalassotalea marina TaxID=1673741 RepID=A0A919BLY3_9GAMM|nr:dienelactone hydrolase family protein [Thalassotalea marina]GHG00113.1 hypothetical protein GCM10017161_30920 [Thalassotalea marina]